MDTNIEMIQKLELSNKNFKTAIIKCSQKLQYTTYKGAKIQIPKYFQPETIGNRKKWPNTFQVLK